MSYLQTRVLSHSQRVCALYKKAARTTEDYCTDRIAVRYRATLLRARFDQNKDIKDTRLANKLLVEGEQELFKSLHPQPKIFHDSPGGIIHGRVVTPPDWVLDYWDPIEKAAYPKYFATREQRKREYLERWEKKYGKEAATE